MENCAGIFLCLVVAFLSDKEKGTSTTDRKIVDSDSSPMGITDNSASYSSNSSDSNDEKISFVEKCFNSSLSYLRVFVCTMLNNK